MRLYDLYNYESPISMAHLEIITIIITVAIILTFWLCTRLIAMWRTRSSSRFDVMYCCKLGGGGGGGEVIKRAGPPYDVYIYTCLITGVDEGMERLTIYAVSIADSLSS